MSAPKKETFETVAQNREARFRFFILETFEAGIVLRGSEVKSIREGGINLKEGYAHIRQGELFLEGVHISPYSHSNQQSPPPVQARKLLMHRKEIDRIAAELAQKKLTIVPLKIYFKNGRAKLELGLAKGKQLFDKRADIKKRESDRMLARIERKNIKR